MSHMLRRYIKFRDVLPNVEHSEVKEIIFTNEKDADIAILLKSLTDLNSFTVELQSKVTPSHDARVIFDRVLETFPNLTDRLGARCAIVESPTFEEAIWKVQRAEESSLKGVKVRVFLNLLKTKSSEQATPNIHGLSFAHRDLKRFKKETEKKTWTILTYVSLFRPPASASACSR